MRTLLSPLGRYEITLYSHEAFNSCWVDAPTILDKQTGQAVWGFQDTMWSLDESEWLAEDAVKFVVRKYPGNHQPRDVTVAIDLAARTARIADQSPGALEDLEPRLEKFITWFYLEGPEPLPGLRGRIRRFFKGY